MRIDPPRDVVHRPEVFAEVRRWIFHKAWQYAGPAAAVAEPGDFVTDRAGDVPLVVVRAPDGELNAFVNVCRHGAAEVVLAERGNRRTLQCHYHAWTYRLDGALAPRPARTTSPTSTAPTSRSSAPGRRRGGRFSS